MQAALDLARSGIAVHLVTRDSSLGGKTAQLDKVFPVTECAMCLLGPRLEECRSHPEITIHTLSELTGLAGEAGAFTATVVRQARYVDPSLCTSCGACEAVCPVTLPSQQDSGLAGRKVIHKAYAQAVPPVYAILAADFAAAACLDCRKCEAVCGPGAINLDAAPEQVEIEAGAVIVSTGFEFYDASLAGQYGYGHHPNVVTSMEFERLISPTGPGAGVLTRPSDGGLPRRIAFIQCVGSRHSPDASGCGAEYCSSICCMYSVKQAIMAREIHPEIETEIFLLDLRAFGKGFERYVMSAEQDWQVKVSRQMVSTLREDPETADLTIRHGAADDPRHQVETRFDLVVLAVGLVPPPGTAELAARLGVDLAPSGFLATKPLEPGHTTRAGIFVAGASQGPRDLAEAIIGGSAAAAEAAQYVAAVKAPAPHPVQRPAPQLSPTTAPPRIGVFICRCGADLDAAVDVLALSQAVERMSDVYLVQVDPYSCAESDLAAIRAACAEHGLDRVVIGACSPHSHRAFFATALLEAGIDPSRVELVNLRDHCARVHRSQPELALAKARDMMRMAVSRIAKATSSQTPPVPVTKRALVVGGGLAGMTAALALAGQGIPVDLVERRDELGGNLLRLHRSSTGQDLQGLLRDVTGRIKSEPLIHVHLATTLAATTGNVGRFRSVVEDATGQRSALEHGVTIVATGAEETDGVTEYLRGSDPRVLSSLEFEHLLATDRAAVRNAKRLVFIQCAGTRTDERPYCSRTCCVESVQAALEVKKRHPEHQIFVLYRDVRTFGDHELLYREARDAGVVFLRYEPEHRPQVRTGSEDQPLTVLVRDPAAQIDLEIPADHVVLALGMEPGEGTSAIAQTLRLPRDEDGFLQNLVVKPGPTDFPVPGMYLCGLCHAPKMVEETIEQARAAAARAATVVSQDRLQPAQAIAIVEAELCAACLTCVRLCPYHVPVINQEGDAEIDALACRGCGTCAAECPAKAIMLACYTDEQMIAQVAGFGGETGE